MIPIAGSAYTYAYATMGELVAWIIGWDLILEYAVGNVAVAISWAGYFKTLLAGLGIHIPDWLSTAREHVTPEVLEAAPHFLGIPIVFIPRRRGSERSKRLRLVLACLQRPPPEHHPRSTQPLPAVKRFLPADPGAARPRPS